MWESFSSKWSTRSLGGPLFPSEMFNNDEDKFSELSKWKLDDCVFGFKDNLISDKVLNTGSKHTPNFRVEDLRTKLNAEIVNNVAERSRRRRPTYSPKVLRALSKGSEESPEASSGSEDCAAPSKDLRESKILNFRKTLLKTIKIKSMVSEKVRVTCSKDGKHLEWFKSKSEGDVGKKVDGRIAVSKITNVSTKSDNVKHLEISTDTSSYVFVFRSREEREQWQNEFKKFLDFMKLAL